MPENPKKILVILHQKHSTPGRLGLVLQRRGFQLDIRRPRFGDPLPGTMRQHRAAIIFGGPMSSNDTDAWMHREIDWISVPLKENSPFLGICLGAQMMARQLGAVVHKHPDGCIEAGYYPIQPTPAGKALISGWPKRVYQWHSEGFDLPAGTTLLARGRLFPNQAFVHGGTAYAIQFHPELTLAMMHRWTTRGAPMLTRPCAQDREAHFIGRASHDRAMRAWLAAFLDLWLGASPQG